MKTIEVISCILINHNGLKLEINSKGNYSNTWGLNNTLLNGQWIIEVIKKEIIKFLGSNKNENKTYQNLWDTANASLKGKFMVMIAYIRKSERSQINNLKMHLKLLEKQE
jgi:hypothetical protein